MQCWVRGVGFPEQKRYEDVRFNGINITRGWVGVKYLGKNVTLHFNGSKCTTKVFSDFTLMEIELQRLGAATVKDENINMVVWRGSLTRISCLQLSSSLT